MRKDEVGEREIVLVTSDAHVAELRKRELQRMGHSVRKLRKVVRAAGCVASVYVIVRMGWRGQ